MNADENMNENETQSWLRRNGESEIEYSAFSKYVFSDPYKDPTIVCEEHGIDYSVQFNHEWAKRADDYYAHTGATQGHSTTILKERLQSEALKVAFQLMREKEYTETTQTEGNNSFGAFDKTTTRTFTRPPDGKLVATVLNHVFNKMENATSEEIHSLLAAMVSDGASGGESPSTTPLA